MFENLFSTTTKKQETKKELFSNLFVKKTEPVKKVEVKPEIKTLPSGGQYLDMPDKTLTTTPRGYGTLPTKIGEERDHIIPVALGGTSNDPNLQYLKSDKTLLEKILNKPASAKNRQEGKMLVEWAAIKDYNEGKIELNEARVRVLNWDKQPESFYKFYAKELVKSPITAAKKVGEFFGNLFKTTGEKIKEGKYSEAAVEAGSAITEKITKPLLNVPVSFVKEGVLPAAKLVEEKVRQPLAKFFEQGNELRAQQLLDKGTAKNIEDARQLVIMENMTMGMTEPLQKVGTPLKAVGKKVISEIGESAKDLIQETKKYKSAKPITNLNPTGGLFVDYTPQARMTAPLGENITTLANSMKKSPDTLITVYRGAPKNQAKINPGDFITTDYEMAKSYTNSEGKILESRVRLGDILDDIDEPLGGDYLYRPGAFEEVGKKVRDVSKSEWYNNYLSFLKENPTKFKNLDEWLNGMKASGKSKSQITDIWNKANKNVEIEPLIQEAKKYKSAEEFVKAQGTPVYHGTQGDFEVFAPKSPTERLAGKAGTYFTTNLTEASGFGKNIKEVHISPNAKIKVEYANDMPAEIKAERIFQARREGYDAVQLKSVQPLRGNRAELAQVNKEINELKPKIDELNQRMLDGEITPEQNLSDPLMVKWSELLEKRNPTHTIVFNTDIIKTKSQLTDIWNKAQEIIPKAKELKPIDYFKARQTRLNKLKEAREGEMGIKKVIEFETNQEKLSQLDNKVINAIKNTPYYKKEGVIQDFMGDGVIMRNPATGKTLIAKTTKDKDGLSQAEKYFTKGYKTEMSIDTLAQEAGFERGYDFLQEQLDISKLSKSTDITSAIEKELLATDPEFKKATDIIQQVSQDKVPKGQWLTQKAKVEINEMRKTTLRTVRDYFGLSDKDMRNISTKDVRYMSNKEYNDFIQQVEKQADILSNKRQKLLEVEDVIRRKELQNVDNLRKIQQLPKIENMTAEQLDEFGKLLDTYKSGDVFITPRRAEVLETTDLKGARTWREVREKMAQEFNVPIEELSKIKVKELDRFKGDIALARDNPLFNWMVGKKNEVLLKQDHDYFLFEDTLNKLVRKIKKNGSVLKKVSDWIVPQQKELRAFLEAEPQQKAELAKKLSTEEIEVAGLIRRATNMVYDYLLANKELLGSRFANDNYIMHSRRPITEMIKDLPETGIKGMISELLQKYKMDEATFTILDKKTGDILAPHKFFKNTLFRSDEMKPTENIIEATKQYMKQFYTKKALDEIVPKIETYVMALQPTGKTKKGMFLDESLKKFTNEWLNAVKGRNIDFVVKQGGKLEAGLRAGKMMMSTLYLGFNLATGLASKIGSQISAFGALGNKKYLIGRSRMYSKQGQKILENYKEFVGKNVWEDLIEPAKNIGDKLGTALYGFFKSANFNARANYLLGEMTEQEFKTSKISTERLAEMKLALGRWLDDKTLKSIVGRTEIGKTATQFKDWAIPILDTVSTDAYSIAKKLINKQYKEALTGQEIKEIGRVLETGILVYLGYEFLQPDKDDKSLIGQLKNKATRELSTFYQALSPTTYLTSPVLADFIFKFAKNLESLLKLEKYKTGEKKGELKGVEALKQQFTPTAIKQLKPTEEKKKELPTLPKLPKISLPKLPKL